jgi:hypothetical protein
MTVKHLTVNTRRGPISFSTDLEWDEAISMLASLESSFAQDLLLQWERATRPFSPTQIAWVYKLAEDSRKPPQGAVMGHQVDKILGSLKSACAKGLKRPALRLLGPDGEQLKISFMTQGRNEGGCWVTMDGNLVGKITPKGEMTIYDRPELEAHILQINDNLDECLKEYGLITSACSCCGRTLTDPKSVTLGIGPICAEKFSIAI